MAQFAKQAKAQNVNIVNKFESSLAELLAVLGKSDVNVMAPGTALKIYKSAGTLKEGAVAENAEIPNSGIVMEVAKTVELTYHKFRNLTSVEKIGQLGYDIAVLGSNEAMLRDVQGKVRKTIYDGLGEGTSEAQGATFQAACANAWGKVTEMFEGEAVTPVFFVNPMDAAGYLGTAAVTTQTAFGMNYIQNFLGLGNALIDSNVPAGTVYGTAVENIDVCAASIASIAGLDMHTDRSGIIAIHNGAKVENAAIQTVAICGIAAFPVYADRVVKATISA